jgi:dihydropteroate synthase
MDHYGNTTPVMIFGVLNVTPDSFSDGGQYVDVSKAYDRCTQLFEDGADVVDIGAESTRPGAPIIDEDEEWFRLADLLKKISNSNLISRISLDTRKASIMHRGLDLGIGWINTIGDLPEEGYLRAMVRQRPEIGIVATHMHGTPQGMQTSPLGPSKIIPRITEYFDSSRQILKSAGVLDDRILLDPGIGFGKTDPANLKIISWVHEWSKNFPIGIGVSRKSLFSRLFDVTIPKDRDPVSKVCELGLIMAGARMIRTHDVAGLRRSLAALREAQI